MVYTIYMIEASNHTKRYDTFKNVKSSNNKARKQILNINRKMSAKIQKFGGDEVIGRCPFFTNQSKANSPLN